MIVTRKGNLWGIFNYLSFDYYPKKSMSFTDYPFHLSSVIGETNQVKAIENDGWTHKNIALVTSSPQCSPPVEAGLQIAVFKAGEHKHCIASEARCVHFRGVVSNMTSGFESILQAPLCLLFIDSMK